MKGRKIILLLLILIFLALGSYLILLSQGFIFDYEGLRFVKTGAIFLSFEPSGARLELNGEPTPLSLSLLRGGALINNLRPDEYSLRLFRENFHDWRKTVAVAPGLVTELEDILLVPQELKTAAVLTEPVEDFWLTDAGVIYRQDGNLILDGQLLRGENVVLNSPANTLIVTETAGNYFLTNLGSREAGTNLTALFNSLKQRQLNLPGFVPIRKVSFHPFSSTKLLIFTNSALYELEVRKISLEQLVSFENEILAETLGRTEVFAADDKGGLTTINLLLKNSNIEGNWAGQVKDLHISADGKKTIVLHENGSIEVIERGRNKRWLLDVGPADVIKPLPTLNDYLLLLNGRRLIMSESREGQPTNSYELATEVKKFEVDGQEIYFLQSNGVLKKLIIEF